MASTYTQKNSPIQITTPFGADKLIVNTFQGEERLSNLFSYSLEMISEASDLDFTKIVGKAVTVSYKLDAGATVYYNGIVGRFIQSGTNVRFTTYRAEVHPWLWLLTMNSDCRIFQAMKAPDIIKKVFSDAGFTDFKDSLTGTYTAREYCVQYMETNFHFVSRLMEEEGIFYYFEHTDSAHTLVLADGPSAIEDITGTSTINLRPGGETWDDETYIDDCSIEQRVTVGQYQTDDFNFETPSTDLLSKSAAEEKARSLYEYPGRHMTKSAGDAQAAIMLHALETPGKVLRGVGPARAFRAGAKFTLAKHPRADVNQAYYLKWVSFRMDQNQLYSNSFEALPASVTFRPPRTAPKARVYGAQTAIVTGTSGEEIYTDKYGRVKVHFHWDQLGTSDEKSSCWLRVAQGWAGKSWGAMFIPRIGQEVIVSFLEGDPDRPIVTGSVYNAEQTIPYAMPDNMTRSTIKSNSSKGGGGFNEFRFEDKKDSEEIFMQAQKDLNITVLNDRTETITNNRTTTISKKNDTLTISEGNRAFTVSKGNETHDVKGTREVTVTGAETHTNKDDFTQNVTKNYTLKVDGNISIEATGKITIKSGQDFTSQSQMNMNIKAEMNIATKATMNITTEATIGMTNKGVTIENNASATLTNKAAAMQTVDGGAMLALKGGLVKIN